MQDSKPVLDSATETRRPGRPKRDETTNTERRRGSTGSAMPDRPATSPDHGPAASTTLQVTFHQGVASPRPSNPEPLLANADVYS